MNLAIEYMIRTGTLEAALSLPCAIYLNHIVDRSKKIVLTIKWHDFTSKCLVRQWRLHDCSKFDLLPPFDEISLDKEDLASSDFVIIPMYEPLPFNENPYKSGVRQRGDGLRAMEQEREYQETIDSFFYTKKHKRLRLCWLWAAFIHTFKKNIDEALIYKNLEDQIALTKKKYKTIWLRWLKWQRHLDFDTDIAPELIFANRYTSKSIYERKDIDPNQLCNIKEILHSYSPPKQNEFKPDWFSRSAPYHYVQWQRSPFTVNGNTYTFDSISNTNSTILGSNDSTTMTSSATTTEF